MNVLGGDISLISTGLCLPTGQCVTIKTGPAKFGDQRFVTLRKGILYYCQRTKPTLAVIERASPHMQSEAANVAIHGAQAIVREVLAGLDIPIAVVSNKTLKRYATGRGEAEKQEMIHEAIHWGGDPGINDDEADAWWLRAMGWEWLGSPIVRPLDPVDLDGHDLRYRCVFGPWPLKRGVPVVGSKWPDRKVDTAASHLPRPGHSGPRKTGSPRPSPPAR